MLTNFWRSVGRLIIRRETLPDEFRAERMDASWRPVYLELRGHESPTLVQVPYILFQ